MKTVPTQKWTIPESEAITGVPFERTRDWVNRGYIIADHPASGRGTKNKLSPTNLYQIKVFDFLVRSNVSRKHASDAVKHWDYDPKAPYMHILRKGDDVRIEWFEVIQDQLQVKHYTKDDRNHGIFEMMIVVDVGQIIKDVDSKL